MIIIAEAVQIEIVKTIGILAAGLPAFIAALFSYLSFRQSKSTHRQVNGLLEKRIAEVQVAAEAKGVLKEKERVEEKANASLP